MMNKIRYGMAFLLVVLGGYGTYIVLQKSTIAATIVGTLTLCVVIPILLEGRARSIARNRVEIGEEPSSKMGVGVRQARAMALREEGEITGAPAPRR